MDNLLIVFAVSLLIRSAANISQPRGLIDEAKEQLEQLRSLVYGDIMVAHDDLDDLLTAFRTYALDLDNRFLTALQIQNDSISNQLKLFRNMAEWGGYDISACIDTPEEVLNGLPDSYKELFNRCLQNVDDEAVTTARNAKYVIDINMNKVHDLENQLNKCGEDLLCVSPVVSAIEVNKIRMPQNIKTEVLATENLMMTMRGSVQHCADDNMAACTSESYTIVDDIRRCIDRISH